jgi:hypothetical protein
VAVDKWRSDAIVYETPEAHGENARDESLRILRAWLVARCDAVVCAGGKWWDSLSMRQGVPQELALALERGLPCFLLGGLGGAARDVVERSPDLLARLKNGLDASSNRELALRPDVGALATDVCSYLERLPLVRGRGSDGVSFRILALDGGGLKGTFTAAALAAWERQTGLRVVDHFDLVAGTSTGGILAIGIGLGLTGAEMLKFYRTSGPKIFPVTRLLGRHWHNLLHIVRPKYAQEVLLRELQVAYYKGRTPRFMRDSYCRLLVPSYHAVAGASHVFRTPHHPDLTADARTEAAQAALATSAAPTYFSAATIASMVSETSYFDGGVWANSPVLAAVVEAVCFLRIPLERIEVLSVGTTDAPFTVRKQAKAGIAGWMWKKKIIDLLMNVQQESSLKLARSLVTDPRFLRVNKVTIPGDFNLDSPAEIEELAALGELRALDPEILGQVKSRFLNGVFAVPWESFV